MADATPVLRQCLTCGNNLSGRQSSFCSYECRAASYRAAYQANKKENDRVCKGCGQPLTGRQTVWCSLACKSAFNTETALVNGIATLTRKCRTCGLVKVLANDFYQTPNGTYRRICRSCVMQNNTDRDAKPDKMIVKRNYHLTSTYGISHDEYEKLLQNQGGVCAICGKPPLSKRLSVDHDHVTKQIRGLLCNYCNLRIVGKARDASLYRRAAEYLEQPPGQVVLPGRMVPGNRPRKKRKSRRKSTARR